MPSRTTKDHYPEVSVRLTNVLWRVYGGVNPRNRGSRERRRVKRWQILLLLLLLTWGALLVHGYHPYAEDAEIYLPGVERILQPELFPGDARLFDAYVRSSLFAHLIAGSVRFTHFSLETTLFLWHLLSLFLLLLGCRKLCEQCFVSEAARWCGVSTIAALLTLPVAGTALYLMDQYLNPRNLAAFAGIFTTTSSLRNHYWSSGCWILFAVTLHPLMGAFVLFLAVLLWGVRFKRILLGALLLPMSFLAARHSPAYIEAARLHSFHYLFKWRWYEWAGIIAPLGILWLLAVISRKQNKNKIQRVCRALILYGLLCFAAAILFSLPGDYSPLARFQPLRSLHLLYLLLFLFLGGFCGEFLLQHKLWRWAVLFVPLCGGM